MPGSPHKDHMTNGGGWAVKFNQTTKRFIAYQRDSGDMTKREAQTEAIARNRKNQDERDTNDQIDNNLPGNPLETNIKPLYKEPRLQVKG